MSMQAIHRFAIAARSATGVRHRAALEIIARLSSEAWALDRFADLIWSNAYAAHEVAGLAEFIARQRERIQKEADVAARQVAFRRVK